MEKWGNWFIFVFVLSYLVRQICDIQFLDYINAILTIIIIGFTVAYSKKLPKLFSFIMLVIGGIILFTVEPSTQLVIESVTKNLPLVCLIIVVPILSVPIHLGKYNESIAAFLAQFKNRVEVLYMLIYSFFYVLAPITNLGSLHIIHSMVKNMNLSSNFLGRLYTRAFTSINTWAPYFASVFLVVYYLKIPMYVFIPFGLLLSIFQFATAVILFSVKEKRNIQLNGMKVKEKKGSKSLIELLLALLLLIGVIFVLEPYIKVNVSVLIIILAIVFSLIWAIYLKKTKGFVQEVNKFTNGVVRKQSNEIALFLTAGFFGVTLAASPISGYVNALWSMIGNQSFVLLTFFTILIVSFLSIFGIHQIVIVSSILASVSPDLLGIHPITFAMMLLSAWAIGSTVSPIAPGNVIVSNLLQINIFKLIFKMNLLFTTLLIFVHTIVIYIVHLLI
ncbi:hypothetical protein [Pseudogracilibacillus sp. SO30301A]|uniref:hypothetical protein n=1 Tax=Pseudogracilibacillus sp. SO30301A TaxID=3098291 RepID=UPI00300DEAD9